MSVEDVCSYLGIGRDTIYKWLAAKSLPAFPYRLGRLWKFKKKASALQFTMSVVRVGGLLHFMLPESSPGLNKAKKTLYVCGYRHP